MANRLIRRRAAVAGLLAIAGSSFAVASCRAPTPDPGYALLQLEDARVADAGPLLDALSSPDERLQGLAVRAIGRIERLEHAEAVLALAASPSPFVRREAANALGQMRAVADLTSWLAREQDASVRAALYHTIGRVAPIEGTTEPLLAAGLAEPEALARLGAAHGLEAFVRLNARTRKPAPETIAALRQAFRDHSEAEFRELVLLALSAAGERDAGTLALALADAEPQVRRLAVMALRQWVDDPSPIVRYEALRLAPTCDRAVASLDDPSGHVALLAVDLLGTLPCPAASIEPLLEAGRPWRVRARAIVSLARVAPDAAKRHLEAAAADPIWQARAYAARAAKIAGDERVRARLASDAEPNVVIEALDTPPEAIRALDSNHRGLLMAAARRLEGTPDLAGAVPRLLAAFVRLSREDRPTSRDARMAVLERLGEALSDPRARGPALDAFRPSLADRDPVVAARVASLMTTLTGAPVEPVTARYRDDALPDEAFINGLRGATAVIGMRGLGTFTIELLTDEAPATVGIFARHAEAGGYDGTTFHRVVPNFVLQGGSHGANEYDGAVGPFMRDELGLERHLRGTLGISTRGRDTGDGQIFVNLVDNFRLDHNYTVWARVIDGMDLVDRILEGDVIDSVTVMRRPGRAAGAGSTGGIVASLQPALLAQAQGPPLRLNAIGINFNDLIGLPVRTQVAIDIARWSTAGEREAFSTAIRSGGVDGLLELIRTLDEAGSMRIENDTSVKFHIALVSPGRGGGQAITLIGDRPVLWEPSTWGVFDRRALEYRFVAVQLQLDGSGRGSGRLSLATRVTIDRVTRDLVLDTWELLYVDLRDVRRSSASASQPRRSAASGMLDR